jgi:DNA recombination protein RmuC
VVRQAVENFSLEKVSHDILSHLGAFNSEWKKYKEQMGKIGESIKSAWKAYEATVTTRTNQLQRPLDKLEELRLQKSLLLPGEDPATMLTQQLPPG